uniref:Beta-lactamase n=1 Tax=Chelativorans sp. (strain BNC1) TaxID=266779 RepID=Q11FY9_CHESB
MKWAIPLMLVGAVAARSGEIESAQAQERPVDTHKLTAAAPEDVGFSPDRLSKIGAVLRSDIERGKLPGAVVLVARHGKIVYNEVFGVSDPEHGTAMRIDSIFRLYSMSKPITQVAAMMLVEDGKIGLEDPISKYLPEFENAKVGVERKNYEGGAKLDLVPVQRPITIHDLMRHTSGMPYGFSGGGPVRELWRDEIDSKVFVEDLTNAQWVSRMAKLPLTSQPGTEFDYGHSTDALAAVVEVVSGQTLLEFQRERIFKPLGMVDTDFYIRESSQQGRIAEPFPDDQELGDKLNMHDPRNVMKWESGGGGLASTAFDYARFLQMLLNRGHFEGHRYLGPLTVDLMTADHLGENIKPGNLPFLARSGYGYGLGFAVRLTKGISSVPGSVGDYEWGGIAGTYFWVDPAEDMFAIFLSAAPTQHEHYRKLIRTMVYSALVDRKGA